MVLDPSHLIFALISGVLPALLWLRFWLDEDNLHPEPRSAIVRSFIAGCVAVLLVIPLQLIVQRFNLSEFQSYVSWAFLEEIVKLFVAFIVALNSKVMDEPIDALIYLITVALGFAALENVFFVLTPISQGLWSAGIITGSMRFVGASLLHIVSSASIGICIAYAYYRSTFYRSIAVIFGIILATSLHASFNLLIIRASALESIQVFGLVWIGIILLLFLFERVKTIKPNYV